jgi:hypothetical protein
MQSPENTPPKLHGASRTSGGISRGQATGNFLNAADFSSANKNDYIGPVRGQIKSYVKTWIAVPDLLFKKQKSEIFPKSH